MTENQQPLVSIISTVYNGIPYLQETVFSIFNQSFQNFEYIIVDDGSTDSTSSYLKNLQTKDHRLKVIFLPRSGRGVALNTGLSNATSDLVAILDADDLVSPVWLSVQYQLMTMHPKIDVLSCFCSFKKENLKNEMMNDVSIKQIHPKDFLKRTPIIHSGVIMRRNAILSVGGYSINRKRLFDYNLWIRMAKKGFLFAKTPFPLVFKRIHQNQNFEKKNRLPYLLTGLRERLRAFVLFSRNPFDLFYPFAAFFFGLIPIKLRQRLFGLSGEKN